MQEDQSSQRLHRPSAATVHASVRFGRCCVGLICGREDDQGTIGFKPLSFRIVLRQELIRLPTDRFHDGRHTALTRLAEKGVPDWVIRAKFGHVSTAMMAVYSHVRRKALDEAAKALE